MWCLGCTSFTHIYQPGTARVIYGLWFCGFHAVLAFLFQLSNSFQRFVCGSLSYQMIIIIHVYTNLIYLATWDSSKSSLPTALRKIYIEFGYTQIGGIKVFSQRWQYMKQQKLLCMWITILQVIFRSSGQFFQMLNDLLTKFCISDLDPCSISSNSLNSLRLHRGFKQYSEKSYPDAPCVVLPIF